MNDSVQALKGHKVSVNGYATMFQDHAGLAMRVRTTVDYLQKIGVDARLTNLVDERLDDFDLVHVVHGYNANHRLIQSAKGKGKPVVLSPVLVPPYSRSLAFRANILSRLFGKATGYEFDTTWNHIVASLEFADHLIALGHEEKRILTSIFSLPAERITIIPNGVGEKFLSATPDVFRHRHPTERPVVLHVGIIGAVKNQLGLVRALRGQDVRIVLIGACSTENKDYLNACIEEGRGNVLYLGELAHTDPLIPSMYAAADVMAVPSMYEGMSNCVLEALASGTPVVSTKYNSFEADKDGAVYCEVDPRDEREIRDKVIYMLDHSPPAERCKEMVRHLQWTNIAHRISDVYAQVLGLQPAP